MGTSVYPVVGRLRRTLPILLLGESSNPLRTDGLTPNDFEFLYPDDDGSLVNGNFHEHLHSNYPLFSWLADARGEVQPLSDYSQNRNASEAFCQWLDTGTPTYLDSAWEPIVPKEGFYERYIAGWRGPHIRSVDWLLNFNYDVVAQMKTDGPDDCEYDESRCEFIYTGQGTPHPELKTYRELFSFMNGTDRCPEDEYFRYLRAAKANDWDFIIFKFD